jgi:hypothetical protein
MILFMLITSNICEVNVSERKEQLAKVINALDNWSKLPFDTQVEVAKTAHTLNSNPSKPDWAEIENDVKIDIKTRPENLPTPITGLLCNIADTEMLPLINTVVSSVQKGNPNNWADLEYRGEKVNLADDVQKDVENFRTGRN